MKQKLTTKFIETRKPDPTKRVDYRDNVVPGLVLRVNKSGSKTFSFHKRINGKMTRLTIGKFGPLTLVEARERARQILYEIESGRFEQSTGIEVKAKPTLDDVIPDYIENHAKVHNRDWKRKQALLKKFNSLLDRRVDEIKRADVAFACDSIRRSAPVSANRALAHLKHLMNWCVERGLIEISPIAGMKPVSKEKPRERLLSDDELRALWNACDGEGYPFGDCIKFLILSGQRRAEVAEMLWSELDFQKRLWTLPSRRAKNGKQHFVPLTDTMLDVLQNIPRFMNSDFVFTTNGTSPVSGFGKVKKRIDSATAPITEPWILHDLRRTMATNLAELRVPQAVTEALLNHKSGVISGVVAIYTVYSFAEEKREALLLWSNHISNLLRSAHDTKTKEVLPTPNRSLTDQHNQSL